MATFNYLPCLPWDVELIREGSIDGIEASGQSWQEGAFLIDSSGSLAEASADPTAVLGLAVKDATGTTGKSAAYWPLKAGRLYVITFDGVIAQSDINTNVGTAKDATTGFWYAKSSETEDILTIKALAPGSAIGDTRARVLVTFDAANIQGS